MKKPLRYISRKNQIRIFKHTFEMQQIVPFAVLVDLLKRERQVGESYQVVELDIELAHDLIDETGRSTLKSRVVEAAEADLDSQLTRENLLRDLRGLV